MTNLHNEFIYLDSELYPNITLNPSLFILFQWKFGTELVRGLGIKSWQLFFPSHLDYDTTK